MRTLFKQLDKVGKTRRELELEKKKKAKQKEPWHADGTSAVCVEFFKLCSRSEEDWIHAGGMVFAGLTHMFNTQNGHREGAGNTDSTLKSPLLQQRSLSKFVAIHNNCSVSRACFNTEGRVQLVLRQPTTIHLLSKHLYSRHTAVSLFVHSGIS